MIGRLLSVVVRFYQLTLGQALPSRCRYEPSCSNYALEALRTRGVIVAIGKITWRLLRCAPWGRGGFDPVTPSAFHTREVMDG